MARRAQQFRDHWKEQRLFLSRVIIAAIVVVGLTGLLIGRLVDDLRPGARATVLAPGPPSRWPVIVLLAASWLIRRCWRIVRTAGRGGESQIGSCGSCSRNPDAANVSPLVELGKKSKP